MINYLTGTIRSLTRDPAKVVIVAGGVGYEVSLPTYVYQSLANDGIREGSEVELEIYYHVTERQPKPMLVGFRHPSEKAFFEQLIQVEGIGPAKAAAALVFPVSTIASAIETEDLGSLQRLPGIGSRAAQKIVATLRGKVAATALLPWSSAPAAGAASTTSASGRSSPAVTLNSKRCSSGSTPWRPNAVRREAPAADDR